MRDYYSRFAHLYTANAGTLEVSFTSATSEDLSLQDDVLCLQVGNKFGRLVGGFGNAKFRSRYASFIE